MSPFNVTLKKQPAPESPAVPAELMPPGMLVPVQQTLPTAEERLYSIAAIANVELTPEQSHAVNAYQEAKLFLGSAASAIMVCDPLCPRATVCPLFSIKKAPYGCRCPLEMHQAVERFLAWCRELGVEATDLTESERVLVSDLSAIDIQIQRCYDILAQGEATKLTQMSVMDVDVQTGKPIAFEYKIHQNQQILEQLNNRRSKLMKEWELTPEAKSRKNKGILRPSGDLATKSAATYDRLRAALPD